MLSLEDIIVDAHINFSSSFNIYSEHIVLCNETFKEKFACFQLSILYKLYIRKPYIESVAVSIQINIVDGYSFHFCILGLVLRKILKRSSNC